MSNQQEARTAGGVALLKHLAVNQGHIVKYILIGGFVYVECAFVLHLLLAQHVEILAATSIAFFIGVSTHFALNKYTNFRNFDRTVAAQLRTYGFIIFVSWLITLGVVYVGVRSFHVLPMVAQAIAAAVNLPIGFLSHRYLTFGRGITAAIRSLLSSSSS